MTASAASETLASSSRPRSRVHEFRWPRFFVAMASVLAAIVAIGFAPSFYLRPYLATPPPGIAHAPLPAHLYVHGIVLTCWFMLFLAQTMLVASRRVRLHRFIGVIGAGLALGLCATSMLVVIRLAARAAARGNSGQAALIVAGDTGLVILFALLVVAGIGFRQRRDIHRRLMLIASISLVAPALARFPGAEALVPISVVVPQLALLAALVVYDIRSRGRMHAATVWGIASYLAVAATCTAVGFSSFGPALVKALA